MDWEKATSSIQEISKNTFGREVQYLPSVGGESKIRGIFDNAYVDVKTGNGVIIRSLRPILCIKLSDLSSKPTTKDYVVINEIRYRVSDPQDDGQGGCRMILEKIV